jgi:hypothetical protein
MTQGEVEEWLEHVPVYAVTDANGAGVVLKPENDTSVFYFFLNPLQANMTMNQLQVSNTELDLKVSAFSLGKIWFQLLNSNDEPNTVLKTPSTEENETSTSGIAYRLVPDTRDLLGARMLLTMTPEDGEQLKKAGTMTPEMAQAAIHKAMTESPKFNETYNEIPVFTIAQMRMQKQASADGETPFMAQAPADVQGVEPAINLMGLHELVGMMMHESEVDWRNVVLVPTSAQVKEEPTTDETLDPTMAQMGGATLGDV